MSKICHVRTADLSPNLDNARTHTKNQIRQLADSICRFGFINPVLIDENNQILGGHARLAAARKLGLKEVPCLRITHLSEIDKKAYAIADNKIAQNGNWNEFPLAANLNYILASDPYFDVSVIGFSATESPEIDAQTRA